MCSILAMSHDMAGQSSTLKLYVNPSRYLLMPNRYEGFRILSSGFGATLVQAVPGSIGTKHEKEA